MNTPNFDGFWGIFAISRKQTEKLTSKSQDMFKKMYIIARTQKNRPKLFTETFGIDYTIFEKKNSVFLCSSKNWKKTCPESFIDIKYNIFTDELSKKIQISTIVLRVAHKKPKKIEHPNFKPSLLNDGVFYQNLNCQA